MIFEIKVIFEDDDGKEGTSKEDEKTTDPVVEDDGSPINRRR